MDTFTRTDFQALREVTQGACVSIYLPTYTAGEQGQQNPIRLKNLLRTAEEKLVVRGMRPADARSMLVEARELVENEKFWKSPSTSLALFISTKWTKKYRLPLKVNEQAWVEDRFLLRPMWDLFTEEAPFALLAISENQVRFFRGNQWEIIEVEVPGLPESKEKALNLDTRETVHGFHLAARAGGGKRDSKFHGQGGSSEVSKDETLLYFRVVEKAIGKFLNQTKLPLIFAGVDSLVPIYRSVNTYPNLLEEYISGNPDRETPHDLHEQAMPVLRNHRRNGWSKMAEQFEYLVGLGKASGELAELFHAARAGQVETLFLARSAEVWGEWHEEKGNMTIHMQRRPESQELLGQLAMLVSRNGGTVYSVESSDVPGKSESAGFYRFAVEAPMLEASRA